MGGNVNVDDQRVTPDENSKSDEEIEMRMSESSPIEKRNNGNNEIDINPILQELQKAVYSLDLKRHWEVTSAIIQSEDEQANITQKVFELSFEQVASAIEIYQSTSGGVRPKQIAVQNYLKDFY